MNPAANPLGKPNSAAFHSTRALKGSKPAPTLANGTASTTSTAIVALAGSMAVPVAAVTGFAVGKIVSFGGHHWTVGGVGPGLKLSLRHYFGATWPAGTNIASGSQVLERIPA